MKYYINNILENVYYFKTNVHNVIELVINHITMLLNTSLFKFTKNSSSHV